MHLWNTSRLSSRQKVNSRLEDLARALVHYYSSNDYADEVYLEIRKKFFAEQRYSTVSARPGLDLFSLWRTCAMMKRFLCGYTMWEKLWKFVVLTIACVDDCYCARLEIMFVTILLYLFKNELHNDTTP